MCLCVCAHVMCSMYASPKKKHKNISHPGSHISQHVGGCYGSIHPIKPIKTSSARGIPTKGSRAASVSIVRKVEINKKKLELYNLRLKWLKCPTQLEPREFPLSPLGFSNLMFSSTPIIINYCYPCLGHGDGSRHWKLPGHHIGHIEVEEPQTDGRWLSEALEMPPRPVCHSRKKTRETRASVKPRHVHRWFHAPFSLRRLRSQINTLRSQMKKYIVDWMAPWRFMTLRTRSYVDLARMFPNHFTNTNTARPRCEDTSPQSEVICSYPPWMGG